MVWWARSARRFRWCAQRPVATSGCGVGSVLALVTGCVGRLERRRLMKDSPVNGTSSTVFRLMSDL